MVCQWQIWLNVCRKTVLQNVFEDGADVKVVNFATLRDIEVLLSMALANVGVINSGGGPAE